MEIVSLNKNELQAYIKSETFLNEPNLPISFHRALSHIANPKANANDQLLFLAKEGDEIVGYLGILPDLFFAPKQPIVKVGWASCLWVAENARGKGVAKELFRVAHFKYNGNLLSYDYVPATKRVYDNTGFFKEEPLIKKGIRLYIKADFERILAPKSKLFEKGASVLKGIDAASNSFLELYQAGKAFPISDLNLEQVTSIGDELNDFIQLNNSQNYFPRAKRELNWILQFPWVIENDELKAAHQRYFFSSSSAQFENLAFQLKDENGKISAFFFFTIRDGIVKLPYFFGSNATNEAVQIINHFLQKWKAKEFTCFHPKLVEALEQAQTVAFHKKEVGRYLVVDKQLSKRITHVNLFMQDGDGDAVFT